MSRGGGSRKGFLVWLEDMIDVSMKHAPATTRMLLERKLKEPVPPPGRILKEGEQPEKARHESLG